MRKLVVIIALVLTSGMQAAADPGSAERAKEVLKQAQQAAKSLNSVSYDAIHLADGDLMKQYPILEAKVLARRAEDGDALLVHIEGTRMSPRATEPASFRYVSNGKKAMVVDDGAKLARVGSVTEGLTIERVHLLPAYYLVSTAYETEMSQAELTYVKTSNIGGVDCDVVDVQYKTKGRPHAKFFIGAKDHLLRRLELPNVIQGRVEGGKTAVSAVVFTVTNLVANEAAPSDKFKIEAPAGYRVQPFAKRATRSRQPREMLKVGSPAPDWTLTSSTGEEVSLKSLRGKVVVLDFWASWCRPCKMGMPGMEKLHKAFEGKPVKIFGVNCRERRGSASALAYVKKQGFTYPQLIDGDKVATAYGVQGIPVLYVIDQQGKILHIAPGFRANQDKIVEMVINKALKE